MTDEIVTVDIETLGFDPKNARKHGDRNKKAIEDSLHATGPARSIVIDDTDTILAGNGVTEAARKMGIKRVKIIKGDRETLIAVQRDDLTEKEKLELALFDNRAGELAEWDAEVLAELQQTDPDLIDKMFSAKEWNELTKDLPKEESDAEPQIDRAEELRVKWGTELGQLWQIGDHKLVCGDCTDRAVVERVMGDSLANLVIIDPPYGVDYSEKNTFLNAIARGNRIQTPIKNDQGEKADIQAVWKAAFCEALKIMLPGANFYCFMPQGGDQMMMMMMMMESGIEPRHELIWLKNNHVLGRVDYAYKHEPILYAWKDGGHKFYGEFQTSILEFDKPTKSDMHPTTKPVELVCRLIANSSLNNEIVFDGFAGSGTTGIACQNLGRKARLIELDPGYCGVILERFSSAFPNLIIGKQESV